MSIFEKRNHSFKFYYSTKLPRVNSKLFSASLCICDGLILKPNTTMYKYNFDKCKKINLVTLLVNLIFFKLLIFILKFYIQSYFRVRGYILLLICIWWCFKSISGLNLLANMRCVDKSKTLLDEIMVL